MVKKAIELYTKWFAKPKILTHLVQGRCSNGEIEKSLCSRLEM